MAVDAIGAKIDMVYRGIVGCEDGAVRMRSVLPLGIGAAAAGLIDIHQPNGSAACRIQLNQA